jgi:hypothetical protein
MEDEHRMVLGHRLVRIAVEVAVHTRFVAVVGPIDSVVDTVVAGSPVVHTVHTVGAWGAGHIDSAVPDRDMVTTEDRVKTSVRAVVGQAGCNLIVFGRVMMFRTSLDSEVV